MERFPFKEKSIMPDTLKQEKIFVYIAHSARPPLKEKCCFYLSTAVFLNRWVATHFWVAGNYVWVAKTCVIVL